jgi:hypothetical protein
MAPVGILAQRLDLKSELARIIGRGEVVYYFAAHQTQYYLEQSRADGIGQLNSLSIATSLDRR